MPIFYRYITRETLGIFSATCLILLAIIISFRLTSLLGSAATGDLSLSAVWQLIGLQSVRFLIVLMPVSLILAFAMSMGRLYSEQEIPSALACGISQQQICKAVLLLSIPVAALIAAGNLFLLPQVFERQDTLRSQAEQEAAMILFRANEFRRLDDGTVVFTGDASANQLSQFFVYRGQNGEKSVIAAPQGHFSNDDQGKYLELDDGMRASWRTSFEPQHSQLSYFAHGVLRLPDNRTTSSDRLRNLPLNRLPNNPEGSAELQNRINPALALILFSALLPFLARTRPRSSRYQKLIPIFVLFAIYLNVLGMTTTAIRNSSLSPWPGSLWVHTPIIMLLLIIWWPKSLRRKV